MPAERLVLTDMDGVIADLEGRVRELLHLEYPNVRLPLPEDRKTFYMDEQIVEEHRPLVAQIIARPGFFLSLKPVIGAVEALRQIEALPNVTLAICTSPLRDTRYCVTEKYEWVRKMLGEPFVERMIMTRDKTLIRADFLIDDKPFVSGANLYPSWTHIVRRQPYNVGCGKEFIDWNSRDGWKDFYEFLKYE